MAAFEGFSNMFKVPELRRRIVFTLGIIAIYRVGIFITTPGVDRSVMKNIVSGQGGLLGGRQAVTEQAFQLAEVRTMGLHAHDGRPLSLRSLLLLP